MQMPSSRRTMRPRTLCTLRRHQATSFPALRRVRPDGGRGRAGVRGVLARVGAVCPRDNYFIMLVESVFTVKENQDVVDKPRLLQLVNVLRNKVIQKKKGGESQKVTILRNLKFQDADDAGKLNPAEFGEAMRCFGGPRSRRTSGASFTCMVTSRAIFQSKPLSAPSWARRRIARLSSGTPELRATIETFFLMRRNILEMPTITTKSAMSEAVRTQKQMKRSRV